MAEAKEKSESSSSQDITPVPAVALPHYQNELVLPSNDCPNCKVLSRNLKISREWNNFFRLKLVQTDMLLHVAADNKRQKQRCLLLQMFLDQQSRECEEMRDQLTNVLLEMMPLKKKVKIAEQTAKDEISRREKIESSEYNLRFLYEQEISKRKMLDKLNPNLVETLEKKVSLLRANIKKLKEDALQSSRVECELKQKVSLAHAKQQHCLKKARWGLSLAHKYGRCLLTQGELPGGESSKEWLCLQHIREDVENELHNQYLAECQDLELHPLKEAWLDDFSLKFQENNSSCENSGAKQLERLTQNSHVRLIFEDEEEISEERIKRNCGEQNQQYSSNSDGTTEYNETVEPQPHMESEILSPKGQRTKGLPEVLSTSIFDTHTENCESDSKPVSHNTANKSPSHIVDTGASKGGTDPTNSTINILNTSADNNKSDPMPSPGNSGNKKVKKKLPTLLDTSSEKDSKNTSLFNGFDSEDEAVSDTSKAGKDTDNCAKITAIVNIVTEDLESGSSKIEGDKTNYQTLDRKVKVNTQKITKQVSLMDTSTEDSDGEFLSSQNSEIDSVFQSLEMKIKDDAVQAMKPTCYIDASMENSEHTKGLLQSAAFLEADIKKSGKDSNDNTDEPTPIGTLCHLDEELKAILQKMKPHKKLEDIDTSSSHSSEVPSHEVTTKLHDTPMNQSFLSSLSDSEEEETIEAHDTNDENADQTFILPRILTTQMSEGFSIANSCRDNVQDDLDLSTDTLDPDFEKEEERSAQIRLAGLHIPPSQNLPCDKEDVALPITSPVLMSEKLGDNGGFPAMISEELWDSDVCNGQQICQPQIQQPVDKNDNNSSPATTTLQTELREMSGPVNNFSISDERVYAGDKGRYVEEEEAACSDGGERKIIEKVMESQKLEESVALKGGKKISVEDCEPEVVGEILKIINEATNEEGERLNTEEERVVETKTQRSSVVEDQERSRDKEKRYTEDRQNSLTECVKEGTLETVEEITDAKEEKDIGTLEERIIHGVEEKTVVEKKNLEFTINKRARDNMEKIPCNDQETMSETETDLHQQIKKNNAMMAEKDSEMMTEKNTDIVEKIPICKEQGITDGLKRSITVGENLAFIEKEGSNETIRKEVTCHKEEKLSDIIGDKYFETTENVTKRSSNVTEAENFKDKREKSYKAVEEATTQILKEICTDVEESSTSFDMDNENSGAEESGIRGEWNNAQSTNRSVLDLMEEKGRKEDEQGASCAKRLLQRQTKLDRESEELKQEKKNKNLKIDKANLNEGNKEKQEEIKLRNDVKVDVEAWNRNMNQREYCTRKETECEGKQEGKVVEEMSKKQKMEGLVTNEDPRNEEKRRGKKQEKEDEAKKMNIEWNKNWEHESRIEVEEIIGTQNDNVIEQDKEEIDKQVEEGRKKEQNEQRERKKQERKRMEKRKSVQEINHEQKKRKEEIKICTGDAIENMIELNHKGKGKNKGKESQNRSISGEHSTIDTQGRCMFLEGHLSNTNKLQNKISFCWFSKRRERKKTIKFSKKGRLMKVIPDPFVSLNHSVYSVESHTQTIEVHQGNRMHKETEETGTIPQGVHERQLMCDTDQNIGKEKNFEKTDMSVVERVNGVMTESIKDQISKNKNKNHAEVAEGNEELLKRKGIRKRNSISSSDEGKGLTMDSSRKLCRKNRACQEPISHPKKATFGSSMSSISHKRRVRQDKAKASIANLFGVDDNSTPEKQGEKTLIQRKSKMLIENKQKQLQSSTSKRDKVCKLSVLFDSTDTEEKSIKQVQVSRSRELFSSSISSLSDSQMTNSSEDESMGEENRPKQPCRNLESSSDTSSESDIPQQLHQKKCNALVTLSDSDCHHRESSSSTCNQRKRRKKRMKRSASVLSEESYSSYSSSDIDQCFSEEMSHVTHQSTPKHSSASGKAQTERLNNEDIESSVDDCSPSASLTSYKVQKSSVECPRKQEVSLTDEIILEVTPRKCIGQYSAQQKQQYKKQGNLHTLHKSNTDTESPPRLQSLNQNARLDHGQQIIKERKKPFDKNSSAEETSSTPSHTTKRNHSVLESLTPPQSYKRQREKSSISSQAAMKHKVDTTNVSDMKLAADGMDGMEEDTLILLNMKSNSVFLPDMEKDVQLQSDSESEDQNSSQKHFKNEKEEEFMEENCNSSTNTHASYSSSSCIQTSQETQESVVQRVPWLGPIVLVDQPKVRRKLAPASPKVVPKTIVPTGLEYVEKLFSKLNHRHGACSEVSQSSEKSSSDVTQETNAKYYQTNPNLEAEETSNQSQFQYVHHVRKVDLQGQHPVLLPNIYGTLGPAPSSVTTASARHTTTSSLGHCEPTTYQPLQHMSSHISSLNEEAKAKHTSSALSHSPAVPECPQPTHDQLHPLPTQPQSAPTNPVSTFGGSQQPFPVSNHPCTTLGQPHPAPGKPHSAPGHLPSTHDIHQSIQPQCSIQGHTEQVSWLPEIEREEIIYCSKRKQDTVTAIEHLKEILEEVVASRIQSKWWVMGLQKICATITNTTLPSFLRLVLESILRSDPLEPQIHRNSLPPRLFRLFQVVCVVEQHLMPHHPNSLRNALLRAIQGIVTKSDIRIRPHSLASLTAWYVASASIHSPQERGHGWGRGRAFLVDLLFHHPGMSHLAILAAVNTSCGLLKHVNDTGMSGLEQVLVWLVHYGAWVGHYEVRLNLTNWLAQQLRIKKPSQDPATLAKNLVSLLESSNKDQYWGAVLGVVLLTRWQGRSWAKENLLPVLSAATARSTANAKEADPHSDDLILHEDLTSKISHVFGHLGQALPCLPEESQADDIVKQMEDAVKILFGRIDQTTKTPTSLPHQ